MEIVLKQACIMQGLFSLRVSDGDLQEDPKWEISD
jgi:hypothetical protein